MAEERLKFSVLLKIRKPCRIIRSPSTKGICSPHPLKRIVLTDLMHSLQKSPVQRTPQKAHHWPRKAPSKPAQPVMNRWGQSIVNNSRYHIKLKNRNDNPEWYILFILPWWTNIKNWYLKELPCFQRRSPRKATQNPARSKIALTWEILNCLGDNNWKATPLTRMMTAWHYCNKVPFLGNPVCFLNILAHWDNTGRKLEYKEC